MTNPQPKNDQQKPSEPSINTNVLKVVIVALIVGFGFMVYTWNANEKRREINESMDRSIRDFDRLMHGN